MAGSLLEVADGLRRKVLFFSRRLHGRGERMFGSTFERSGNHEERRLQSGRSRCNTDDLRLSGRDSACFIEDRTVDLAEQFKRSALLKRMPRRAPRPVPTMMAVGVARPSAQGQEMTRTEMAHVSAKEKSRPRKSHTTSVRRAMPITTGTNAAHAVSEACNRGL